MSPNVPRLLCAIMLLAVMPAAWAQDQFSNDGNHGHGLRITSATFNNNGSIPYSMVWNQCSAYPGGLDQSPQLTWTGARGNTRSFIVVVYDVTASFTHWAMYNIPSTTTSLPQNAGIAGSTYGTQIYNDFGDPSYDGPCPPTTLSPLSHQYVITVYALKTMLPTIPTYGDFVPFPEALYQAMIAAARNGDITDSASITGYFPGQ